MISGLDFQRYQPREYFVSEGDTLSAQKAVALEKSIAVAQGLEVCLPLPLIIFSRLTFITLAIHSTHQILQNCGHPSRSSGSPISSDDTCHGLCLPTLMHLLRFREPLSRFFNTKNKGTFCRSRSQWARDLSHALPGGIP